MKSVHFGPDLKKRHLLLKGWDTTADLIMEENPNYKNGYSSQTELPSTF